MQLSGEKVRGGGWLFTVLFLFIIILVYSLSDEGAPGTLIFLFICLLWLGVLNIYTGSKMIREAKQKGTNAINPSVDPSVKASSNTTTNVEETDYEVKIIKLAHEKDGLISRVDVVLSLNISSKKAQLIIDELYADGLFDIQLTENGSTLYKLRNYCSSEERQTASSL